MKSQRQQLNNLKSGELAYHDASIYTILLDLVEGNGLEEVFMMLHNVATDLNQREELEKQFKKAKKWTWK